MPCVIFDLKYSYRNFNTVTMAIKHAKWHTSNIIHIWTLGKGNHSASDLVTGHVREREREMFYLTMHSTHFIYGYMASDIWLRTIMIVRKETRCRHLGYSYWLAARIAHTTAFVTPVVEHWLEREIAQWVHPMKDRSDDPSHHERMLLPRSYISLLAMSEAEATSWCVRKLNKWICFLIPYR